MPTQDEQDIENANSRSQQRANRLRRSQSRAARKDYRARKTEIADSRYSSTKILEKLKSDYQKKIEEINSNSYGNQTDANEDISFAGIDSVESSTDAIVAEGSLDGIEIIWADQTETFITSEDILDNYNGQNYWSAVFAVSSSAFTKSVSYDSTQDLWDDVGTDQTVYRLRVKTLNTSVSPNVTTQLSAYGQYREEILCVDGDPVVNLIKIS